MAESMTGITLKHIYNGQSQRIYGIGHCLRVDDIINKFRSCGIVLNQTQTTRGLTIVLAELGC